MDVSMQLFRRSASACDNPARLVRLNNDAMLSRAPPRHATCAPRTAGWHGGRTKFPGGTNMHRLNVRRGAIGRRLRWAAVAAVGSPPRGIRRHSARFHQLAGTGRRPLLDDHEPGELLPQRGRAYVRDQRRICDQGPSRQRRSRWPRQGDHGHRAADRYGTGHAEPLRRAGERRHRYLQRPDQQPAGSATSTSASSSKP